jgi:hypothetical protein
MAGLDRTLEALHEIRDEMRTTRQELREELGSIREELHGLSGRMDRLEHRQVQTEIRLATELVAVVGAVHEVRDAILGERKLAATVDDHERRLSALERRTG